MRSNGLNRTITMSQEEADALIKSLVSAGIDKNKIKDVFADCSGPTCSASAQNCFHCHTCKGVNKVNPDALVQLQRELNASKIKNPTINQTISKLLK